MKKDTKEQSKLIAKKDFLIFQNNYKCQIKKGDNIEELKIPKIYYDNLKTEGII